MERAEPDHVSEKLLSRTSESELQENADGVDPANGFYLVKRKWLINRFSRDWTRADVADAVELLK